MMIDRVNIVDSMFLQDIMMRVREAIIDAADQMRQEEVDMMKKKLATGMTAPNFTFDTISDHSLDFYKTARGKKAVLFFLRYMGCPVCQMKIGEIIRDHEEFRSAGLEVYVVLQSSPSSVKEGLAGSRVPFTIICDREEKVFALYGVAPGNIFGYIGPAVIMKAVKASRGGFRHGKKEGKEMQLPAVFILNEDGKIDYAYYGKNIGDVPDNRAILNAARA
jgi:thioredoxin-dependent peroxiredoxin